METNRSEEFEPAIAPRTRRRGARPAVLLAAGLLGVSAIGYGILTAPSSIAAEECKTADGTFSGVTGTFTIKNDSDKLTASGKGEGKFKNEDGGTCIHKVEGSASDIALQVSKDGATCTLISDDLAGLDKTTGNKPESKGSIRIEVALGKDTPAKVFAHVNATKDSPDEPGENALANAKITGLKMKECKASAVPLATVFTLKDFSITTDDPNQ
ncbi:hypothetical protein [Nocardia sp. NPDC050175]|uniref:hypothetical protein n=1 Tax=Nocardia sp. NPDC050175 TaxID=3364317 RepID=UPI00378AE50C